MGLREDGSGATSVLVVAEADVRAVVVAGLAADGRWRVVPVDDLGTALELVRTGTGSVGCLLVDVGPYPASDASPVRGLRKAADSTGLVLLPSRAEVAEAQVAAHAGDDYVLPDELSTRQLRRAVENAVRRATAARANAELSCRLQALAAGSTDGLVVVSGDGRVEAVSAVAESFLGARAADLHGLALADVPWSFVDRNDVPLVVADRASLGALGSTELARTGHLGVRAAGGAVTRVFLTTSTQPGSDVVVASLRDSSEHLAMEESTRFQSALLSAIGQAVVVSDPAGTVLFWNPAAEALYGWSAQEAVGRTVMEVTPSAEPEEMARRMRLNVGNRSGWAGDYLLRRRDGSHFQALVSVGPVYDDRNDLVALIGVSSDITARKRAEEAARALSAIVESTADAVFTHDLAGAVRTWNAGAERLFGYTAGQIVGQHARVLSVIGPDAAAQAIQEISAGHRMRGHQTRGRRRDGSTFAVSITASPIYDENGEAAGVSVIARDTSERQQMQDQLNHQASHDALTGLPNRTLLADRMAQALASAERRAVPVAVLFIDLDQFKGVNDVHGHLGGDELLIEVARRLRAVTRPADTVARFGGDEFVVVCDDLDAQAALALTARIEDAFRLPIRVGQHSLRVSASIGIAVSPPLQPEPDVLLRSADAALYEAKSSGRARSRIFDASLSQRSAERLELTSDLREAFESEALQLHYQPVIDLATGGLVGLEALARWQHPTRGWVPPNLFVPLAEQNGLSSALDQWVLRRACADAAALRSLGFLPAAARVAVNISANNVGDVELLRWVQEAAAASALPLDALEVEVTETALLADAARAGQALSALRRLGVTVALDDFGTGFSSLTNLRTLPVTTIKIDRSFIQHITDRADDFAIVTSLVELGRAVGLRTVAEGVETPEQLDLLRRLGCVAGQGYLWSGALSVDELPHASLSVR